jgi:hypothetical protein
MADTKISALTSATTPLAGTEVLPIVQSGVTKKVSVGSLTAGRTISALNLALNTTPRAWGAGWTVSELNATVVGDYYGAYSLFSQNNVADTYIGNGYATKYQQFNGTHEFYVASSGTSAASISWIKVLTIDNTGNLVIGVSDKGITLPGGITWTSGSGSPEGVVTAPVGSLYSRSDGGLLTSLYVKQSGTGNTGWAGK